MLRAINYCGLRVEYEFVKKDIKNINIRITPDGSISVSAPSQMPEKKVDSFVEEKAEWIFRKMADVEKRRENMPDDSMYDGKKLFFMGREYTLRITSGKKFEVEIAGDEIIISSRYGDENLKAKYIGWLTEKAMPVFEESLDDMLKLVSDYEI